MSNLSVEAEAILRDAEKSGDTISVLIDDDWYLVRWISDAYDGSDYGCAGFADENDYHLDEDIFEDVQNLVNQDEALSSDAERIQEKINDEEERKEWALLDLRSENREKRKEREAKRKYLIQRYTELAGHEPTNTNMHVLRSTISQMEAARLRENIGKIFEHFKI